jgi:hypothetical protein
VAAVAIDSRVSPAHVQLSHVALKVLGLHPHRRIALTKCPSKTTASLPATIFLHPVLPASNQSASGQAMEDQQQISKQDLQQVFAAWLQTQACGRMSEPASGSHANVGPATRASTEDSAAGYKADAERQCVPLQDGSVVCLQLADRPDESMYLIELRWPAGVPKHRGPLQLSAPEFLSAGILVEVGKAMELPSLQGQATAGTQWGSPGSGAEPAVEGFGEKWVSEFGLQALSRLLPLLHDRSRRLLCGAGAPPPGGLLVCGPAGSGVLPIPGPCFCSQTASSDRDSTVQDYLMSEGCEKSWQSFPHVLSGVLPLDRGVFTRPKSALLLCVRRQDCPCAEVRAGLGPSSSLPHTCRLGRLQRSKHRDPQQSSGVPATPGDSPTTSIKCQTRSFPRYDKSFSTKPLVPSRHKACCRPHMV